MNISPANISIPAVISSVNLPTEQVARDNRSREKILPPRQLNATPEERHLSKEEKQFKHPSWDPAEHPNYTELTQKTPEFTATDSLEKMSSLSSNEPYMPRSENGYPVHMKLPQEVLERLEELRSYRRTGAVVAMRYQQSSVSNFPSEVLVII